LAKSDSIDEIVKEIDELRLKTLRLKNVILREALNEKNS
jgi:hypothetical protein